MPAATTRDVSKTSHKSELGDCSRPAFWQRIFYVLVWTAGALALAVVILESTFRLAHVGEETVWRPDPTLGIIGQADRSYTFRSEGFSQGRFNSAGFNDHQFKLLKPRGVIRIAVLGDSKTEALQVPQDYNFCRVLESRLNEAAPGRFEVMNFGVSAFTTSQEYLLYLTKVRAYKPNLVVLMYSPGDNEESIKPLGLELASMSRQRNYFPRPYFSINRDASLHADWSVIDEHLRGFKARLLETIDPLHSNLWGVVDKLATTFGTQRPFCWLAKLPIGQLLDQAGTASVLTNYGARPSSLTNFETSYGKTDPNSIKNYSLGRHPVNEIEILATHTDQVFSTTASTIIRLHKQLQQDGAELVVAGLPALNNSIFYVRELGHLECLAKEDGFQFINIHRVFPPLGPMEKSPLFFPTLHFTWQGHKLTADALYQQLTGGKHKAHFNL